MDWGQSTWYNTPCKSFADLTSLKTLPSSRLNVKTQSEIIGSEGKTTVMLSNPSDAPIAFMVRARVLRGAESTATDVAPIIWNDNFVTILPGEVRKLIAQYHIKDLKGKEPFVSIEAWN